MTIRKMKIEDYDEVYSLWLSCVGMGLNNLDDSKEDDIMAEKAQVTRDSTTACGDKPCV